MANHVTYLSYTNTVNALIAYTSVAKYVQWGTGSGQGQSSTTLAAAAASTLGANTVHATGATSAQTVSHAGDTLQVVATLTAASGPLAITEAACFDAATSGNMCYYGDFTVITLNANDSIQFTFQVTFSGS